MFITTLLKLLCELHKKDMKIENGCVFYASIARTNFWRGINKLRLRLWLLKGLHVLSIETGIGVLQDHVYQKYFWIMDEKSINMFFKVVHIEKTYIWVDLGL